MNQWQWSVLLSGGIAAVPFCEAETWESFCNGLLDDTSANAWQPWYRGTAQSCTKRTVDLESRASAETSGGVLNSREKFCRCPKDVRCHRSHYAQTAYPPHIIPAREGGQERRAASTKLSMLFNWARRCSPLQGGQLAYQRDELAGWTPSKRAKRVVRHRAVV